MTKYDKYECIGIALRAKLYDILIDLARISRIALDLHYIDASGSLPYFNSEESKVIAYLLSKNKDMPVFIDKYWRREEQIGLRKNIRIFAYNTNRYFKSLFGHEGKIDLLSYNSLLNDYLDTHSLEIQTLPSFNYTYIPKNNSNADVEEAVSLLMSTYAKVLPDLLSESDKYREQIFQLARYSVSRHLCQAMHFINYVEKHGIRKKMGKFLISGTPKYQGRVLSAIYASEGKNVVRFSHGGERGLFEDFHWALAELTYCKEYYLHGHEEVKFIRQRISEKRIVHLEPANVKFSTIGSKKHKEILHKGKSHLPKKSKKTLMYVSGSYLGEAYAHFPALYPPDILVFDWQKWLLGKLKGLGYEVLLKPHPQGINEQNTLLKPYSDVIVDGYFDPNIQQADCYIFDFSGTAFMDAVASGVSMVYFDMGVRKIAPAAEMLIKNRLDIVKCYMTEDNKFRAKEEDIASTIEKAISSDMSEETSIFVSKYFS